MLPIEDLVGATDRPSIELGHAPIQPGLSQAKRVPSVIERHAGGRIWRLLSLHSKDEDLIVRTSAGDDVSVERLRNVGQISGDVLCVPQQVTRQSTPPDSPVELHERPNAF